MNPDYYPNHKTAESITWTLNHPDGHRVTFKLVKSLSVLNVIITNEDGYQFACVVEKARKYWKEYVERGFVVYNKCVDHNMKKFYDMKRKQEEMKFSAKDELKKITKDYYKKISNYALEA